VPHRIGRPVIGLVVGAVVLAAVGLGVWLGRSDDSALSRAVRSAPAGAERLSWTDWAGVRRELASQVDAGSSVDDLGAFLDEAFDADLSSRSALLESAPALHQHFGWSPATVEWELYSQSSQGAVVTLGLPDDADFADLGDRLEALGYARPSDDGGVWAGGTDLLASIDPALTPELAYLALDADDHLLLASDQQAFLEEALAPATGDADGVKGLSDVAEALDQPLSAAIYTGDYACGALAMANADSADQAEAAELIAAAGTVDPYRAFAMGARAGGAVRVAMEFADADQARANADSRAVLASGPAVGQGGDFADRFTLDKARADGRVMTLDLDPLEGQYVLSDLSTGPVLFATC
jgi:hypothetical protein